ncbi:hypothetical protein ACEWY4_015811 [Coilia grayii]|uniref:Deoxyuridine 5'-triphosphate nucleotidohydrolase n=1 Tax=Coilia grayii TaxID=363190 RepID=A0ABD1JP71_9TELE
MARIVRSTIWHHLNGSVTTAVGVSFPRGQPHFANYSRNFGSACKEVTEAVSPSKKSRTELVTDISKPVLKFAKLTENATVPTRGSAKAAGYDLYSAYDCSIGPMDKAIVKTDIQIAIPHGCYGRVAPRSGLAAKHFIDVGAGVVDEDYRGNVGVVLFNFSKETFEVKKGDRIAQLICERICYPDLQELQTLDETERGEGGFGSTGRN